MILWRGRVHLFDWWGWRPQSLSVVVSHGVSLPLLVVLALPLVVAAVAEEVAAVAAAVAITVAIAMTVAALVDEV